MVRPLEERDPSGQLPCVLGFPAVTFDAYAPTVDPKTAALMRLLAALAEDAIFGLSTGGGSSVLEGLGRRRAEAYSAIVAGHRLTTMSNELDHWLTGRMPSVDST